MPKTYKRLGAALSTGTITTADVLYSASTTTGTSTVISTIAICNQASTAATYRICINTAAQGTASFNSAGYLVFGASVPANDTVFLTVGATMDPTNRHLLCSASANTVSFTAFGVENT